MTTTNEQGENHDSNSDAVGEKKALKWRSFVEKDNRAALIELIQTAPMALLKNIEKSILYGIAEEAIPANLIDVPNELYLIYFLVLDPHYFQVKRLAIKNVTIDNVTYKKDEQIPLNVNDDSDCLMLAKVGLTHTNIAIFIDDQTENVRVPITYGDNDP